MDCDFRDLTSSLIRGRVVGGIRDDCLRERLRRETQLDLESCINICRAAESSKRQARELQNRDTETDSLDAIRASSRQLPKRWVQSNQFSRAACQNCGSKSRHSRNDCPAIGATCYKCNMINHFANVCRTKHIHSTDLRNSNTASSGSGSEISFVSEILPKHYPEDKFVGVMYLSLLSTIPWTCTLEVNGVSITFKIDSGADVTALSEKEARLLGITTLTRCSHKLPGPGGTSLPLQGCFYTMLSDGKLTTKQNVYVVKTLMTLLLGRPALEALKLVKFKSLNTIQNVDPVFLKYQRQFPKVFNGLRCSHGKYEIKLEKQYHPVALTTARSIPIAQLSKVKAEFDRMLSEGIISPVEEATDSCSGMVVVPKNDGSIRICVDLTGLNRAVKREIHPISSVGYTLSKLNGAKYFYKLDAKHGFWQIKLKNTCKAPTTFITSFGRYFFTVLPFGISSATEHFSKGIEKILEGQEGTLSHEDDILVFGTTKQEHDARLCEVLTKIQAAGLTSNEKCEPERESTSFLGHIIDSNGFRPDPKETATILSMVTPKNIQEVRKFIGMANHLQKFFPVSAEKLKPLRDLLSENSAWTWGHAQNEAFENIKKNLTKAPTLAMFDSRKQTTLSCDASSFDLGAVFLQR